MNVPAKTEHNDRGKPPIIKRDRDRARNALKAVRKGHSTTMAAQVAGVSRRTLYDWRYKGEEIRQLQEENPDALPLTPYDDDYLWFLRKWEKAEYDRKQELLRRIDEAGEEKWQPNAWLLERLHPEEFSSKQEVRVSGHERDRDVWTIQIGDKTAAMQEKKAVEGEDYEILSVDKD